MPRAKPKSVGTAVRFNALRHGLTSNAPVIPGVESAEEWEAHREAVLADVEPAGAVQSALAERIAALEWRLRRVQRYECEAIAVGRERVDYDFAMQQSRADEPVTAAGGVGSRRRPHVPRSRRASARHAARDAASGGGRPDVLR